MVDGVDRTASSKLLFLHDHDRLSSDHSWLGLDGHGLGRHGNRLSSDGNWSCRHDRWLGGHGHWLSSDWGCSHSHGLG